MSSFEFVAAQTAMASSARSAEAVRLTPAELVDVTVKLTPVEMLWPKASTQPATAPVETLCAKESVQDDEEAAQPSTSNPVLAIWPLSVEKSVHPLPSPALYGTGLTYFLRQPGAFQRHQQWNQFSHLSAQKR
jgi:hypothetical protein